MRLFTANCDCLTNYKKIEWRHKTETTIKYCFLSNSWAFVFQKGGYYFKADLNSSAKVVSISATSAAVRDDPSWGVYYGRPRNKWLQHWSLPPDSSKQQDPSYICSKLLSALVATLGTDRQTDTGEQWARKKKEPKPGNHFTTPPCFFLQLTQMDFQGFHPRVDLLRELSAGSPQSFFWSACFLLFFLLLLHFTSLFFGCPVFPRPSERGASRVCQ